MRYRRLVPIAVAIDSSSTAPYHIATLAALDHAGAVDVMVRTTNDLADAYDADGIVIGPGSPYRDEAAVWDLIRYARERGIPLVGT